MMAVLVVGCAPDPSDLEPTEALTAFLTALERSTHAPEQRRFAYDWIDLESQRALAERARLSASLAGRPFEPWELLVPGRISFATATFAGARMSAQVDGMRATVALPGVSSATSAVPLVREGGRWRIVLGVKEHQPAR